MNTTTHYSSRIRPSKYRKILKKIKSISNELHGFSGHINSFDYDSVWKVILDKKTNEKTYAGAFIDWDNTPRKQKKGAVAYNASPENFEKYFSLLYKKAQLNNTPYIFINAWNEFLYSLILINSTDKMTVSVALKSLQGAEILNWGDMMAASA